MAQQPTPGASVQFSTRELPPQDRIRLWEDHNAEALIALRCRTLETPVLDATEINVQTGQVGLARVIGSPHVVERPPAVIRDHPSDAIACYLTVKGNAFFYHDHGICTLAPGQMIVCDADQPFLRGFSQGLEELAIRIPRSVFRDALPSVDLRRPVVKDLSTGDLHGRTLGSVVGRAVRRRSAQAPDMDLVLGLITAVLHDTPPDLARMHLTTAQAYIHEHLTDPDLGAADVAAAIGLSPRHLSRVFSAADTSVPRYVLDRRLDHARSLVLAGDTSPVQELSARCGFRSATYFSQAFRARFGIRASDLRREVRRQEPL